MRDLNPCRKCGGPVELGFEPGDEHPYTVYCDECKDNYGPSKDRDELVRKWNSGDPLEVW
jgi:hypothetical protein